MPSVRLVEGFRGQEDPSFWVTQGEEGVSGRSTDEDLSVTGEQVVASLGEFARLSDDGDQCLGQVVGGPPQAYGVGEQGRGIDRSACVQRSLGWRCGKCRQECTVILGRAVVAEQQAVGWCGQVVDTNGDGKITAPPWNQITGRGESLLYAGDTTGGSGLGAGARGGSGGASGAGGGPDPKLDTLVSFSLYGVIPSPVDDSVWGVAERFPGYLVRVDRGKNPPQSCILGIGRIVQKPVVRNGNLTVGRTCVLSLTFDHRVCDGVPAAQVLDRIASLMNDDEQLQVLMQ